MFHHQFFFFFFSLTSSRTIRFVSYARFCDSRSRRKIEPARSSVGFRRARFSGFGFSFLFVGAPELAGAAAVILPKGGNCFGEVIAAAFSSWLTSLSSSSFSLPYSSTFSACCCCCSPFGWPAAHAAPGAEDRLVGRVVTGTLPSVDLLSCRRYYCY